MLVASDVAARGVDYPDVSLVVQMGAPDNREQYVHRTGRTGRAGKTGQATLLLSDWEAMSALAMLKDLPVVNSGDDVAALLKGAAPDAAVAVQAVRVDAREKAYQAWLGYYNAKGRALGWDKPKLVAQANAFALGGLGLHAIPELPAKTVGNMGLRGVVGLNVLKGASGKPRGDGSGGRSGGGGGGGRGGGRGGSGRGGGGGGGGGRGVRGYSSGSAPARGGGGAGGRGTGGRASAGRRAGPGRGSGGGRAPAGASP